MAKRAKSAAEVARLTKDGHHWVDQNLYIQIRSATGTRSWEFRYQRDGRDHFLGLGSARDVTLSQARDLAEAMRVEVKRGGHPAADRREDRVARVDIPTFGWCVEEYLEAHRPAWKNPKHAAQWESTLRMYAAPVIGKKPVDEITVEHVVAILKPIWTEKPETASRLRGRIERVLGWAAAHGYRSEANPAAWQGGALQHLLPAIGSVQIITHHQAVPYREMPKLVASLRALDSTSADALLFTILTAARTGETIGATWGEMNIGERVWALPAGRMKAKREHRVPLSDAALAIVERQPRDGQFVFVGNRPGRGLSNMAMLQCLRGLRGKGATVHGLRSSFRDWAAEKTDTPAEAIEAALAHTVANKAVAAYLRTDHLDRRRALMATWATFCMGG